VPDADERVAGDGRQSEESDRCPADKIRKNKYGHSFSNCGVRVGSERLMLPADEAIHQAVTEADEKERQSIKDQEK